MKCFESSGIWFRPGEPSKSFGGILRFNKEGLTLELIGSFRDAWSPIGERYPLIHGVVGDNPYGTFVTLIDGQQKRSRFNMAGIASEIITFPRAVVGDSHLDSEPATYNLLSLRFRHLLQWIGRTGIEWHDVPPVQTNIQILSYHVQEPIQFHVADRQYSARVSASMSHSEHNASVEEFGLVSIEPIGPKTLSSLFYGEPRLIQNLLTFCTDSPNSPEEITYYSSKPSQGNFGKWTLIYDAIFRTDQEEKSIHATEMVATLDDFLSKGINVFDSWSRFSTEHAEFVTVYFASRYAPPRYLEEKFARMLSAFSLLSAQPSIASDKSRLFEADLNSALRGRFSPEEADLIQHVLPNNSQVDMPFRMLGLLKNNNNIMDAFISDFHAFVRSVLATLSFVEHGTRSTDALQGQAVYYAMEKVRLLIIILVLQKLGFDKEAAASMIHRSPKFLHLKTGS